MAVRPRLAYVDLKNWAGLYTKSSTDVLSPEQLQVAENVDYFNKYGAVSKLKGSNVILSPPTSGAISWLGFYKAADLAGVILRHVLIASGTELGRLESGSFASVINTSTGSTTTGRTSGLFHTYDQLDRFLYLTNYDPDIIGRGDQMLKYDGAKFSNWGLTPPGSQELVVEPFSNAASFTASNCTITDDTAVSFDGAAIRITQTSGPTCSVSKTISGFKAVSDGRLTGLIGGLSQERLAFWLYIPRGQLDNANIATTDPDSNIARVLSVGIGIDSSNYWRFDFQKGDLAEGWNLIKIDISTAINNGGPVVYGSGNFNVENDGPFGAVIGTFDPDPAGANDDITYLQFDFTNNGTNFENIRLDKFVRYDQGAPTAVPFGTGTFSGAYRWRTSFVNKYGHESNTGPRSEEVFATNQEGFYLNNIPVAEDKQVVARRLYRTVAGGTIFLRLAELPNNVDTDYVDNVPDGSLSEITAPQAGDFSDDNSPPPKAGIFKIWKRTGFLAGDPQNPNTLYFSEDDELESWPLINAFELDDKITAIYETYSGLVVETETGKWQILGDNPDFAVDKIVEHMGCVGRRAAGTAKLLGYAVDRDGLRLFDLSDTSKISEPIRDKYEDLNRENIEYIHTVHSRNRNALWQFNPEGGTVSPASPPKYSSIFQYQYAVDDVRTGWWSEVSIPDTINILCAEEIEDSSGDFHIYAGTEDGAILEIITSPSNVWTAGDGTTYPVETVFRTPYLRLGPLGAELEGVTGKVEATYLELRHQGDATTWTATIDMAEGPDQNTPSSTATVTFEFGTNNSLLRMPVKFGEAVRSEYLRLTLENTDPNVNSTLTAVRLYFHVREGQFPVTETRNIP